MTDIQKGLRCNIYRDDKNCSNGGISSRVHRVTLIGDEIAKVFEPDESAPAVILVKREIAGSEYLHAEPLELARAKKWAMDGGTFIYTTDSRFPSLYPIPLHDRTESAAESRIYGGD